MVPVCNIVKLDASQRLPLRPVLQKSAITFLLSALELLCVTNCRLQSSVGLNFKSSLAGFWRDHAWVAKSVLKSFLLARCWRLIKSLFGSLTRKHASPNPGCYRQSGFYKSRDQQQGFAGRRAHSTGESIRLY